MPREDPTPSRAVGHRPTMRDVAGAAGVSFKTVSRVVNGEPGVRPEMAERIRSAIDELGYQRDDRASSFRSSERTTRTIGFIQDDVANPFFSAILRGLEDSARTRGFVVLAGSSDGDADREAALISTFVSRRVDGLVVTPSAASIDLLETEIDRGTSVVCVDRVPAGIAADSILTDHFVGGRLGTVHLIENGHRRIAFLGDDVGLYSAAERHAGYVEALLMSGLDVAESLVCTGLGSPDLAGACLRALIDRPDPPTAIFTAQNFVTMGAVRALHQLDQHRSVAQVGFDDIDLADVVEPGISVVPQDPRRLGQLAGERLFARLDGDATPPSVHRLEPRLVARGSGEILGPDQRRGSDT